MDAAAIAATVVEKNFIIIPLCCLNKRGESERLRVQSDRRRSQPDGIPDALPCTASGKIQSGDQRLGFSHTVIREFRGCIFITNGGAEPFNGCVPESDEVIERRIINCSLTVAGLSDEAHALVDTQSHKAIHHQKVAAAIGTGSKPGIDDVVLGLGFVIEIIKVAKAIVFSFDLKRYRDVRRE